MLDEAGLLLEQRRRQPGRPPYAELVVEEDDHKRVEVPGAEDRELPLAGSVRRRHHPPFTCSLSPSGVITSQLRCEFGASSPAVARWTSSSA